MADKDEHVANTNRIFKQHIEQGTSRKLALSFCFDYLSRLTSWDLAEGWQYGMTHGLSAWVMDARGCSNFIDLAASPASTGGQ